MNKIEVFMKKHSTTLLSVIASAGVIGTAVLAAKETPRALKMLDDYRYRANIEDNGDITFKYNNINMFQKFCICWKAYIPAIFVGSSTIICIFYSNYLNKKTQAALMSAYSVLNGSFMEYKESTKKLYGEDSTKTIELESAKKRSNKINKVSEGKEWFFDYQSMRFFESTLEDVRNAEKEFNNMFCSTGYATLNDFYEFLGLDPVSYGDELGWSTFLNDISYGYSGVKLRYEVGNMDDYGEGLESYIISFENEPEPSYIY